MIWYYDRNSYVLVQVYYEDLTSLYDEELMQKS